MESHVYDLIDFLNASPVNFLAAEEIVHRLESAGYTELDPAEEWHLEHGGKYFVTKNNSAVIAFHLSASDPRAGYKIISAHSDSPGFRIKPHAAMKCENGVVKLNTEVYGGPILYTWFDRPLSIAGRVILRTDDPLHPHPCTVDFQRPISLTSTSRSTTPLPRAFSVLTTNLFQPDVSMTSPWPMQH